MPDRRVVPAAPTPARMGTPTRETRTSTLQRHPKIPPASPCVPPGVAAWLHLAHATRRRTRRQSRRRRSRITRRSTRMDRAPHGPLHETRPGSGLGRQDFSSSANAAGAPPGRLSGRRDTFRGAAAGGRSGAAASAASVRTPDGAIKDGSSEPQRQLNPARKRVNASAQPPGHGAIRTRLHRSGGRRLPCPPRRSCPVAGFRWSALRRIHLPTRAAPFMIDCVPTAMADTDRP